MSLAHLFAKDEETLSKFFDKAPSTWDESLVKNQVVNYLVSDFAITNLLDRCLNISAGPSVDLVLKNLEG